MNYLVGLKVSQGVSAFHFEAWQVAALENTTSLASAALKRAAGS